MPEIRPDCELHQMDALADRRQSLLHIDLPRVDELTPRRWKTLVAGNPMTSDVAATADRLHVTTGGAA